MAVMLEKRARSFDPPPRMRARQGFGFDLPLLDELTARVINDDYKLAKILHPTEQFRV